MKLRTFAGIIVMLLLVTVAFQAVPTPAYTEPPIKVGIIGPMFWIQGTGMMEGATLAAEKINAMGGILGHEVVLQSASTHANAGQDPTTDGGTAAMTQLMSWGADFVIGGFRTEAVLGAREVAMANKRIFIIAGAATDELIDKTPIAYYPNTVRGNYAKYKYMFRATPINSTMLFKSEAAFLKYTMITKMMPVFSGYWSPTQTPLKIAVVSENLEWTNTMHYMLSWEDWWNHQVAYIPPPPPTPPYPVGYPIPGLYMEGPPSPGYPNMPGIDVVYETRVDPLSSSWVDGVLTDIADSGARIIIESISGPVGRSFAKRWAEVQTDAILVGIDVPGQEIALHWTATEGKCETETFLVTAGGADNADGGTPINTVGPIKTVDYYHDYYTKYGHAPIYTSYGTFDALMGLKQTIEEWAALGYSWPYANQAEYDILIPVMEKSERMPTTGKFKYTGPNPGNKWPVSNFTDYDPATPGDQGYPYLAINPDMKGTLHDVYCAADALSPTWPSGYTRALVSAWQAGRLEVVFPVDQPYSKAFAMPYWMYPYRTDVSENGKHDGTDLVMVSYAYLTKPGDARWNYAADTDDYLLPLNQRDVDGDDVVNVSYDYGEPIPVPLP